MVENINERIDRERKAENPQPDKLRDFRRYARGRQRGTLTEMQERILRGLVAHPFCDNVCRQILLACTSRLQLVRYDCANQTVLNYLHDLWVLSSMALLSKQVNYATARDGNHAVSLSWDNESGRVILTRERWWNGKSGIFVGYDDRDKPTYAVKEWTGENGRVRRVVWWPDRIERYILEGAGWRPFALDDGTPWTSPWVDRAREPLGLPVVHFRNVYTPNDSADGADANDADAGSSYGLSELDGGLLGLQDEINDLQRDITAAARLTAYQMLWASGIHPQKDNEDNVIPPIAEPGAVWWDESEGAAFGTLPAGDITQLANSLNVKLETVSRMTGTPMYKLNGQWPSGEALIRADQPLIEKVLSMAESIGPAYSSLAHKATLLYNTFGPGGLDTDAMITSVFAPPDRRDPLTLAQIAAAVQKFVSRAELLRILGKSPDQIEQIIKEMDEDKAKAVALLPAAFQQPATNGSAPQEAAA